MDRLIEHYRQDEAKHFEETYDLPDWYWELDMGSLLNIVIVIDYCKKNNIDHIYVEILKLKACQILTKI